MPCGGSSCSTTARCRSLPRALGVALEARAPEPERLVLALEPCRAARPEEPCARLASPLFVPGHAGLRVVEASDAGGRIEVVLAREPGAPESANGVLSLLAGDGRIHNLAIDVALAAPRPPLDWAGSQPRWRSASSAASS